MPRATRHHRLAAGLLLVLSVTVIGCGGSSSSAPVSGGGSELFPAETLSDWVSYADHVAVFSVASAQPIPPDPADVEHGGGLQGRDVTLRIERILWTADGAPALPEEIHMQALGWVLQEGGERREAVTPDAPRVDVGERYVAPLARVRAGTGELEWWPLSIGAQLPVSDGEVKRPNDDAWRSPILDALAGTTLAQLESLVHRRAPDPLAAKYMHLRPQERVAAVGMERAKAQGVPSDGPSR
jgi:hypothetical protein